MESPIIISSTSREEYISKVCAPMTEQDCLQKASYNEYEKFAGALAWAFNVDPKVIGQISNLDFLTRASIKKDEPVNYIQWIVKDDNIDQVIHYLFMQRDPTYDEDYEHTDLERGRIDNYAKMAVAGCFERYSKNLTTIQGHLAVYFAKDYIRWLAVRLWQDPDDFLSENECYLKYIAKAFIPYVKELENV